MLHCLGSWFSDALWFRVSGFSVSAFGGCLVVDLCFCVTWLMCYRDFEYSGCFVSLLGLRWPV